MVIELSPLPLLESYPILSSLPLTGVHPVPQDKDVMDILFLERKRERDTYSCIHWLTFECALTRDRTHNLGVLGYYTNPLNIKPGHDGHFRGHFCIQEAGLSADFQVSSKHSGLRRKINAMLYPIPILLPSFSYPYRPSF